MESYGTDLVNFAIIERTGILSPDLTIRATAVNIATILGSYGQLSLIIGHIATILNYKPFELATKLEAVFREEFDRISHYNLLYYADITKELLVIFNEKDEAIQQKEIGNEEGNDEEESKSSSDPAKLASALLKKQADASKKPTKKPSATTTKAPVKTQSSTTNTSSKASTKKPAQTTSAQPLDKEQRNKLGREQLLSYFS